MGALPPLRLRYTRRALRQLFAALDYVERRSPKGAAALAHRLEEAIELLRVQPQIGVAVRRPGFRRFLLTPYPYVALYEPTAADIVIHSIRHAARKPRGP